MMAILPEETAIQRETGTEVRMALEPPLLASLLDEGAHPRWKRPGMRFPTFTRVRPWERKPPKPVGVSVASARAKERWENDFWAMQVYQYEDDAGVFSSARRSGFADHMAATVFS